MKLPAIPTLSANAADPLMEYHWPGNVRELENMVERALILNPTGPLTFESFNLGQPKNFLEMQKQTNDIAPLDKVISQHIQQALSITKGKVNGLDGAAALLGVNPNTLRNRMKKLGIVYGRRSFLNPRR